MAYFLAWEYLLCLIGILSYSIKYNEQHHNHPNLEILNSHRPRSISAAKGLDRRTIEAYPVTLVGQSRQLPNPNDNICSICLCAYQAEEMLRTIPNYNHYFHVICIDEWLKLNATCPICRYKYEESAPITPILSSLSSSIP